MKYEHRLAAAHVLGGMLAEAVVDLLPDLLSGPPLVVPVPFDESNFRQRGFNLSEWIARALVAHKPMGMNLELAPELLVRLRATDSETGRTRQQRIANLGGGLGTPSPIQISGRNILLVDDFVASGTTATECARVLRWAGARRVWVVTVAQALEPETAMFARAGQGEQERALGLAAGAH